jgi:hypothetical protein
MWFRNLDEDRSDWMVRHINRPRWVALLFFAGFGVLGVAGRVIAIFHENLVDRLIPLRTPWNALVFLASTVFGVWFWITTRTTDDQPHDSADAEGDQ